MQGKDNKDKFVPKSYKEGTGIVAYDKHTSDNLTSAKGVTSSEMTYIDFVKESLGDLKKHKVFYFGTISDHLASDIYKYTGLNLKGFNIVSASADIRHAMKQHSDKAKESAKGQIALNVELLARLPEVYNAPDSIALSDHVDSRGRTIIKFEKRVNGIIVVVDAISNGKNRLSLDTMYIKKSHPTGLDVRHPKHNVQNGP